MKHQWKMLKLVCLRTEGDQWYYAKPKSESSYYKYKLHEKKMKPVTMKYKIFFKCEWIFVFILKI